jgi:hypothetical protein
MIKILENLETIPPAKHFIVNLELFGPGQDSTK